MVYAIKSIHCAHQYHWIFRNTTCLMQWHMYSFYKAITDCRFHRAVEKKKIVISVLEYQKQFRLRLKHMADRYSLLDDSGFWIKLHKWRWDSQDNTVWHHGFPRLFALSKIVSTKFHRWNEKHSSHFMLDTAWDISPPAQHNASGAVRCCPAMPRSSAASLPLLLASVFVFLFFFYTTLFKKKNKNILDKYSYYTILHLC